MLLMKREELTGFRQPTGAEVEGITRYMQQMLRRRLRPIRFWLAVCSVIAGAALITLVGNISQYTFAQNLARVVFFLVFEAIVFFIRREQKRNYVLAERIADRKYQVLDCRVYEVTFSIALNSEAEVKVYNQNGQYCKDKFLLDIGTAKKCKSNNSIKLLLLKCGNDCYELLSEYRLGGE